MLPRCAIALLLLLAACREEHSVGLSDWLEATVKKPVSGIISVQPNVVVKYRGKTIVDAQALYYLAVGADIILRDDTNRRALLVDHRGEMIEMPCPNGAILAPERFPGVDCMAGYTSEDFKFTRYGSNGRVVEQASATAAMKRCGGKVGHIGYDSRGEPVVAYECNENDVRICRATTLAEPPTLIAEMPATTRDVDCGYLIRTEQKPALTSVKSWMQVE